MQETPQYAQLQQRFLAYSQEDILGQNPGQTQPINEPEASIIRNVIETIQLYFNDTTYRQTLIPQSKQNIEGHITAILDHIEQIRTYRAQSNLPQQLPALIQSISSNYDELRVRFLTPYKMAQIEGKADTARIIADLQATQKEAIGIKEEIGETLQISKDYAERKSSTDQANFFHRMHNGKPFPEAYDDSYLNREPWQPNLRLVVVCLAVIVLAVIAAPAVFGLLKNISRKSLIQCLAGAGIIFLAAISYGGYRLKTLLDRNNPGGYERAAKLWLVGIAASLVFVGVYSVIIIQSLNITEGNISIQEAVIKAIVLFAPVYLIRFCVRNYNAYKHLSTRNLQRATSIRATELFIQGAKKETLELYMKLADHLFRQDETGFITKRDGAGSNDTSIDMPILKQ